MTKYVEIPDIQADNGLYALYRHNCCNIRIVDALPLEAVRVNKRREGIPHTLVLLEKDRTTFKPFGIYKSIFTCHPQTVNFYRTTCYYKVFT